AAQAPRVEAGRQADADPSAALPTRDAVRTDADRDIAVFAERGGAHHVGLDGLRRELPGPERWVRRVAARAQRGPGIVRARLRRNRNRTVLNGRSLRGP